MHVLKRPTGKCVSTRLETANDDSTTLVRLNAPGRPTSVVHQGRGENARSSNSLTARTQKESRLTGAVPSRVRSFGDVEVVVGRPFRAVDGCAAGVRWVSPVAKN